MHSTRGADDSQAHITADRYERLELIGTGSFGDVYRGWDREAGVEVAVKVIDLENVEEDISDIHKEVATLAQCRSGNITEYYAAVLEPGTTELLIVMELMACSVGDLLSDEGSPLDERSIALVLRETLKALAYLHDSHRIHRDVKSANILLSAHGEVKISDFGVSGQLSKTVAFKRRTFVGSPFWMAPEVIKANTGGDGYSDTADIWSLGITAFEMATGAPPHADLHPMRALFLIPAEDAPRLEGPFSQELKSFIAQCLQKEPSLRPSARVLARHPFLSGPHDSGRLAEIVQVHSEKKRREYADGAHAGNGFEPPTAAAKWDFDTLQQRERDASRPPVPRGSLRSHQINNLTIRGDSTWGATFASRQLRPAALDTLAIESDDAVEGSDEARLIDDANASSSHAATDLLPAGGLENGRAQHVPPMTNGTGGDTASQASGAEAAASQDGASALLDDGPRSAEGFMRPEKGSYSEADRPSVAASDMRFEDGRDQVTTSARLEDPLAAMPTLTLEAVLNRPMMRGSHISALSPVSLPGCELPHHGGGAPELHKGHGALGSFLLARWQHGGVREGASQAV